MLGFSRLPKLPRASGTEPGPLRPSTWNALCNYVEALERRFSAIQPKASSDIGIRSTADGFMPFLKKRPVIKQPPILSFQTYDIRLDATDWKVKVKTGLVTTFDPIGFASPTLFEPTNVDTDIVVNDTDTLYCKVTTDKNDVVTAAEIIAASSVTDTHAQPDPGGTVGTYYYKLADFETADSILRVKTTFHVGGNIIHRPGRNNRNLKITIQQRRVIYNECPPGVSLETVSSDEYIYYRKGLYVGVTDPGLESGETETERIVTRLHA